MVRVITKRNIKEERKKHFFDTINIVYIVTIIVSILLIFCAVIPSIGDVGETILVSIGCSGIAAAVMSIFLDFRNKVKDTQKKDEQRQQLLYGLYIELQHLFERVLWFDKVLDKLNLEKDLEYYGTFDFVRDAFLCEYYRATSIEECKQEIEEIIEKYIDGNWQKQDDITCEKIQKMFCIIGTASNSITIERDLLIKNQMFLLTHEILSAREIGDIYTYTDRFVDLLKLKKSNYGAALRFLLDAYILIHNMCKYRTEMFICWQPEKRSIDMLIEERKKEVEIETANSVTDKEIVKKKKRKKRR